MAKVLVIRASSFGDVAMLVPVVFSVAAKYPQDRFTVMTRKAFVPLFENLGFNVNIMPLDVNGRHKGSRGLFRILRRAVAANFSHVADEHDVIRSKIIRTVLMLSGKKVAVLDKAREQKKNLIATKNVAKPVSPTIERYLQVFAELGFPAELTFNNIFDFVSRDFSRLNSVVTEKKGKWIGIAPFARHRGKIYPLEKMENVVEALSRQANTTIFLFGSGENEHEVIKYWCSKYPNTIDVIGKMNIERELLLISYMDVMVSMDSANMHLASLVNVPVVSIWGATHPAMGFYGFRQDINNAVQIDLQCRPCSVYGELPCIRGDYACLTRIDEAGVVQKVLEVLQK